jgi:CDP-paratose 2-epimerase
MKILITGICGYLGSSLVRYWQESGANHIFYGIDNLSRQGSETNRLLLKKAGVKVIHGDIRLASDFESLPRVDWVIDAAANPSVLAGTDGTTSSRQLVEHNLIGTLNTLEFCKAHRSGLILMSTSRVYSIAPLASLSMGIVNSAFAPIPSVDWPLGFSTLGVSEKFSTTPPVSLYGATKVAAEALALEYSTTFDFPVWINRCGVLAGAGQFGHAEQGIISYWIHSWAQNRPLKYIGFGCKGYQVRDLLHPSDLLLALEKEIDISCQSGSHVVNFAGGVTGSISLALLSEWCHNRFGPRELRSENKERPFDIPWLVLDCTQANHLFNWTPTRSTESIFEEIARFAVENPHWLDMTLPS